MSSAELHIAIYGAVANIPPQLAKPLPWLANLKRSIKVQRDILRVKRKAGIRCDYRDYSVDHASNIGDIAIAETIRRDLRRLFPNCSFSNVNWDELDRLQEAHARRKIDLLVVAGGGYFLFNHAGQLPPRLGGELTFLRDTGIPYAFWGVGVNQPFNPRGETCRPQPTAEDQGTLKALLDGAMLISVRDTYSADYLTAHTQSTVHLVGDPALHVAAALGIPNTPEKQDDRPVIGVNFPFHGPTSNRILLDNLPAYVRALQAIQRESGCRFRYIIHHACGYIVPRLLRSAGVAMDIVHTDLSGTCSAYRGLDLHIGGMLHSCILSASVGTPWIAIAYDIKHRGFNSLMGMDDYYQDTLHFSESALATLALDTLRNHDVLRNHISSRRAELQTHITQITTQAMSRFQAP